MTTPVRQPLFLADRRVSDRLRAFVGLLRPPATRHRLAWLLAAVATGIAAYTSWTSYDKQGRRDGNDAHVQIDFGGQWLAGRMVVTGRVRHLYDRKYLWKVAEAGFPRENEALDPPSSDQDADPTIRIGEKSRPSHEHDAEQLMGWLMGEDNPEAARTSAGLATPLASDNPFSAAAFDLAGHQAWLPDRLAALTEKQRGGALYPPVHAFYYAPLALLAPQPAYRVFMILNLGLTVACGWLASRLMYDGVWWPIATTLLFTLPGYPGALILSQNSLLSLFFLLAGWVLMTRGHLASGGLVWGLLAFKPVWAVSFLAVPLLTRRWRAAAAMTATGAVLIAVTLPFTGLQPWLDWMEIGRDASDKYRICESWIYLSRDVTGLFRRWLLTFPDPGKYPEMVGWASKDDTRSYPGQAAATALGLGLWFAVAVITLAVAFRRPKNVAEAAGPGAAFVQLAAWLCCFHFMYYDSLLAALPLCLLFTRPWRYLVPRFVGRKPPPTAEAAPYYQPKPDGLIPPPVLFIETEVGGRWVANPFPPTLFFLMICLNFLGPIIDPNYRFPPFDTFCLLALWAWCGWVCWKTPAVDEGYAGVFE